MAVLEGLFGEAAATHYSRRLVAALAFVILLADNQMVAFD